MPGYSKLTLNNALDDLNSNSITECEIIDEKLDDDDLVSLALAIQDNTSLKILKLYASDSTSSGIVSTIIALHKNKSIIDVCLYIKSYQQQNIILTKIEHAFSIVLRKNTPLIRIGIVLSEKLFYLDGFDNFCIENVAPLLERNRQIRKKTAPLNWARSVVTMKVNQTGHRFSDSIIPSGSLQRKNGDEKNMQMLDQISSFAFGDTKDVPKVNLAKFMNNRFFKRNTDNIAAISRQLGRAVGTLSRFKEVGLIAQSAIERLNQLNVFDETSLKKFKDELLAAKADYKKHSIIFDETNFGSILDLTLNTLSSYEAIAVKPNENSGSIIHAKH